LHREVLTGQTGRTISVYWPIHRFYLAGDAAPHSAHRFSLEIIRESFLERLFPALSGKAGARS
jgi:hypothetical protein